MDIFLHGLETIERNEGPRPVETIDTGIIGMVFTAPDANADLWPLNTPIAIHGYQGGPKGLGTAGTGLDMIEGVFDQATRASQTIVGVRVTEGANEAETRANILGSSTSLTGLHALRQAQSTLQLKPKLLVAPGYTSTRPTDGVATIAVSDAGTGYTTPPTVSIARGAGDTTGVGASAIAILDSDAGVVSEIVLTNPGSGYTEIPTVTLTGGGGTGATATATLGTVNNPVTAEMLILANRLRAGVIVDGPNTTAEDAVAYRQGYATDRLLIIDPFAKVAKGASIVSEPSSARVAGLQARVDYDEGFWYSPSNHVIEGVIGTSRPVEHSLSDPSVESQYMNRNAVATIVQSPSGGYKLWGNRVPSGDTLKLFWSVRRSHDTIIESIERAHEPFLDKPFSVQILSDIAETVNAALRRWEALGATLGGKVWLDRALNTKETWATGHLYVSYDGEAPAPMEHITFIFNRNTGYYDTLSERAVAEIARLSGRAV
ncbi:phage tail sheath subtilisin-like domain-containing protein [Aurantimonas sp. DM33-3]|uniref:phage tail sheath subtilisin-like domain-containing protein n=1 Tax=Aurantimonas sp. DM33-3 TaxID=2766955 RepID=UPI0016522AD4|nr:phage tail sheath subtilisin-like domain-containing protein [Aurantimonas sp. DM33-3]MBC6714802.1 phage tail sheath subtilisin-like domain-containing protein [Aurantimonas sp. DM33-3]